MQYFNQKGVVTVICINKCISYHPENYNETGNMIFSDLHKLSLHFHYEEINRNGISIPFHTKREFVVINN